MLSLASQNIAYTNDPALALKVLPPSLRECQSCDTDGDYIDLDELEALDLDDTPVNNSYAVNYDGVEEFLTPEERARFNQNY